MTKMDIQDFPAILAAQQAHKDGKFEWTTPSDAWSKHGLDADKPLECWEGCYLEDGCIVVPCPSCYVASISIETGMVEYM